MNSLKINSKMVEDLLKSRGYEVRKDDFKINFSTLSTKEKEMINELEKRNDLPLPGIFDEIKNEKNGVLPSQKEFLKRGMERVVEFWKEPKNRKGLPSMNSLFFQSIMSRLARSYKSYVVEYHTEILLKEILKDEAEIITHIHIDLTLGVDIVVRDFKTEREYYIHIFKDSFWGHKAYENKKKRGFFKDENGKWQKFERDFKGHIKLTYEDNEEFSFKTKRINNIPVFKKEYIELAVEKMRKHQKVGNTFDNSELDRLKEFLIEKKIEKKGFSFQ